MRTLIVQRKDKILKGVIDLPASKSISNRVLMIQFLSKKNFRIDNLSNADDTLLMLDLLRDCQ